jgi:hypothetical protein
MGIQSLRPSGAERQPGCWPPTVSGCSGCLPYIQRYEVASWRARATRVGSSAVSARTFDDTTLGRRLPSRLPRPRSLRRVAWRGHGTLPRQLAHGDPAALTLRAGGRTGRLDRGRRRQALQQRPQRNDQ